MRNSTKFALAAVLATVAGCDQKETAPVEETSAVQASEEKPDYEMTDEQRANRYHRSYHDDSPEPSHGSYTTYDFYLDRTFIHLDFGMGEKEISHHIDKEPPVVQQDYAQAKAEHYGEPAYIPVADREPAPEMDGPQ